MTGGRIDGWIDRDKIFILDVNILPETSSKDILTFSKWVQLERVSYLEANDGVMESAYTDKCDSNIT